ncbi:MAG: PLP-dependent transferase [Bacteroidia bacterium]
MWLLLEHQITTVIDTGYASPINQNPIEMGVDIDNTPASIWGHVDLVAGVLCASRERCEKIFDTQFAEPGRNYRPSRILTG